METYVSFETGTLSSYGGATSSPAFLASGSGEIAPQYVSFPCVGGLGGCGGKVVVTYPTPITIPYGTGYNAFFRSRGSGTYPGFPTLVGTFYIEFRQSGIDRFHGDLRTSSDNSWTSVQNWGSTTNGFGIGPANFTFDTIEIRGALGYTSLDIDIFNFMGTNTIADLVVDVPATAETGTAVTFSDITPPLPGVTINAWQWWVSDAAPYGTGTDTYVGGGSSSLDYIFETPGIYYVGLFVSQSQPPVSFQNYSLDHIITVSEGTPPPEPPVLSISDFSWSQSSSSKAGMFASQNDIFEDAIGTLLFWSTAISNLGLGDNDFVTLKRTYIPYITGPVLRTCVFVQSPYPGAIALYVDNVLLEEVGWPAAYGAYVLSYAPGWTIGSSAVVRLDISTSDISNYNQTLIVVESVLVTTETYVVPVGAVHTGDYLNNPHS